MTTNPDDAREIARDLRTVAGAVMGKAPHLTDLLREAATALDAMAAERDRLAAEVERLRGAWLRVIQAENGCAADGACVNNKRCGCAAEQEMLIREADEAQAALAGEGRND